MTHQDLVQFLQERGAKPGQIKQIVELFSPQAIEELYLKANRPISAVQTDLLASVQREKFVDIIKNYDIGAIPWDLIKYKL